MAILRSFIFRPESNLPRPDSLPVVHPPTTFFFERRRYFEECQPANNMGRHLRNCSIPYTKQRGLETGHPRGKKGTIWDRPFGGVPRSSENL